MMEYVIGFVIGVVFIGGIVGLWVWVRRWE